MLFIGNNWVSKRDFETPKHTEKMYGVKCKKCGGLVVVSEDNCKCNLENDGQLQSKQLVYGFASWLQQENFTNPDMSVSDWVNKYFNELEAGKL